MDKPVTHAEMVAVLELEAQRRRGIAQIISDPLAKADGHHIADVLEAVASALKD